MFILIFVVAFIILLLYYRHEGNNFTTCQKGRENKKGKNRTVTHEPAKRKEGQEMRYARNRIADTRRIFSDQIPEEARLTVDELLAINKTTTDSEGNRWAQLILNAWNFGFICAMDFYKVDEIRKLTENAMKEAERRNS